jgi:hypothetical protein
MPEDEDGADRSRDGHKKLKKPHWRAKLFSKEGKQDGDDNHSLNANADVLEFLGSSPQKPQTRPLPLKTGIPPPRIDVSVSQRWPDSHDISDVASQNEAGQEGYSQSREEQRRKKPRREGLKVSFAAGEPEIIGEGGDEAELPTLELLRSRGKARAPIAPTYGNSSSGNTHPAYDPTQYDRNNEEFKPRIFVRAPPGLSGPPTALLMSQESNPDALPQNNGVSDTSPVKGSFAARMKARMRAEEGLVFHNGLREPSPAATEDRGIRQNPSPIPQRSTPSPLPPPEHVERTLAYSLHPTPAPAVGNAPEPRLHEDHTRKGELLPPTMQPPSYREFPPSPGSTNLEGPNLGPDNPQESTSPMTAIRSAAAAVSEDALGEFASRVNHYSSLFSLAAESVKPVMETSLAEWVRCSTWWILKGRSELENFTRSRQRETNEQRTQPSPQMSPFQAYVDLAKALWVNQYIVPQHPELRVYGNMSTAALVAVVRRVGNQELVSNLELHQSIIANLRALTMSMKRNGILPPEDSGLSQGLDTSIWIKYPFFTPDISTLLSGSASKSMVIEGPRKSITTASIMPLGDTAQRFCYSRMLVNVWLTSDDDKSSPFDVPCMLSVLRDRNEWGVMIAIGSQNDLVNIVVQADRNQGPTWGDVHWSTRSQSMRIRMPRGFELNVQCQEPDFKNLWNIIDYTGKAEASMKPEAGESLIFENVTNAFQYIDNRPNRVFPAEPSKRCRLRVFERTATRSDGFGQRRYHRGFRFIAVTSPKIKTLSSVNHVLGNGTPILFSYLRGDDGAPALMIKIKDGSGKHSMIITFHEPAERSELHALLIGSVVSDDEAESPLLTLSSFSIENHGAIEEAVSSEKGPLKQLQWESVRIIDKKHQTPLHSASPRTHSGAPRICIDGSSGTVTDRVVIGKPPFRELYGSNLTSFYRSGRASNLSQCKR